jgi:hypothetical protein
MLHILEQEGYGLKERDLMRIRARNGWLLRESNGSKDLRPGRGNRDQTINEEDDCVQLRKELEEAIEVVFYKISHY